jgi:hypothetical protein
MTDEATHHAVVASWLGRVPANPAALLQAFDAAFAALWQRSRLTLGDVTMTAIVDRVLHVAGTRFPILDALELADGGLRWSAPAPQLGYDRLKEAIEFVLVELLTVLGNLTAEIITRALHAELARSGATFDDSEDPKP